jgi:hypothetical protein
MFEVSNRLPFLTNFAVELANDACIENGVARLMEIGVCASCRSCCLCGVKPSSADDGWCRPSSNKRSSCSEVANDTV